MADDDDIESFWEGLRPRREPDPPMTEERRQAIRAGRQLGKSISFTALDMVGPVLKKPARIKTRFEREDVI